VNEDLIAWVDESGSNTTLDPGTYIMAAALTSPVQAEALRSLMATLRLPHQAKIHWRDEQASRHHQITTALAAAEVEHLVVITTPHSAKHSSERRRRLTLELLLPELDTLGVTRAILESRGKADDRRDLAMLNYLRQQHTLDSTLKIDHRIGRQEPALWAPDALCGIISSLRSGNPSYYQTIQHKITVLQQPPRA